MYTDLKWFCCKFWKLQNHWLTAESPLPPGQTLGYGRSKSSFTRNSRTVMVPIKSDFCGSRPLSSIRHLSSSSLFLNHLLQCICSKIDGKARWRSSPGPPEYECLWNVSKCPRVHFTLVSVSSGCHFSPQIWEIPPRNFLDTERKNFDAVIATSHLLFISAF